MRKPALQLGALVLAALASFTMGSSASAADRPCNHTIIGFGRSSHVDGSADFERYRGQVPANLARTRAIAAWEARVSQRCPGLSAHWFRAHAKSVACEGSAGHDNCTAKGLPARKLWGLWRDLRLGEG